MAGFKTGFALGVGITAALAIWWTEKIASRPISFPSKLVSMYGDYLTVEGSIVGDEKSESERPVNNMARLSCYKPDGSCQFLLANEVSPGHVASLGDDTLAIRKWDDREMVADSLDLASQMQGCNYYEIRVLLQSEDVTYTRLPNPKADKKRCDEFFKDSKQLRQWRIDNGKGSYGYVPGE